MPRFVVLRMGKRLVRIKRHGWATYPRLYQTEAQTQGGKLEPIQPPREAKRGFGSQPWRLFHHIIIHQSSSPLPVIHGEALGAPTLTQPI